mmetsp:Transcript_19007/g.37511  ORF Transcript_19007/g.37511 Transcript_19007/m.37511 type:complete len:201 (+) Transcript_19007:23-625(+)
MSDAEDSKTQQQQPVEFKSHLEASNDKREIGHEAVWTLSSAKPGNGVDQLRDDNIETFWQSDGTQPHFINILFHKKMRIREVCLYADYKLDESYTPNKISLRAGTGFHDLKEVQKIDLDEPSGWVAIDLSPLADDQSKAGVQSMRAHLLQIAVLASHQNGRDTHIRQVKIYGHRQADTLGLGTELSEFSTLDFSQFSCIR